MALERDDAYFHVSHWGVENTTETPHRVRETNVEPEPPSKDIVMSDGTTSASAAETQMILEHDGSDLKELLAPPSMVVPPAGTQEDESKSGRPSEARFDNTLPHPLTNALAGRQQISISSEATAMLAPTPTFTPRRSPRASASASNSRANSVTPDVKAFNSVKAASTSLKASNTPQTGQARTFPIPEHIQSSAFREGFISSAFPSPSLFEVTHKGTSPNIMLSPGASERNTSHLGPDAPTPAITETLRGTEDPAGMDVKMEAEVEQSTHTMDISLDPSPTINLLFTPLPRAMVPERLQFPPSIANLSALFASPVPHMSHPVLSPFRLHQDFQSFSMPQLSKENSSTPPPMTPPPLNADDDSPMKPAFPMQDSPLNRLASSALSDSPSLPSVTQVTSEQTSAPQPDDIDIPLEIEQKHECLAEAVVVATKNPIPRSLNPSVGHATPIHPSQGAHDSEPTTRPTSGLQGSLTPLLGPTSIARLPFPITPQRIPQADFFTPVRGRGDIFAPVENNQDSFTSPFAHASGNDTNAHTPSRIPVSVSTPSKSSSSFHTQIPVLGGDEARPGPRISDAVIASRPNLLSPPTTLQLRQPSNLRNTVVGAASKIPRPGRKPYSKPTSRLPKPKVSAKASPASSVTASKISNPVIPVSPIKTRRGRANQASTSAATQSRSALVELPPDVIIYEPPAPRIRPRLENQELVPTIDEGGVRMEMDDVFLPRASPPVESGFSPPKSGLFLKSESRRLKEEVAANPPGSVIPQFSATAPSLGIFPSLARPKGKGRNTLLRPMMMPLDPTSLRNLTTSNTLRNQHYVCSKVETQVVLKEGKRPASPTSKVKTILEKRKEGQEKSREERAARRVGKQAQMNGHDQEMPDSAENTASRKHPRGAGDEEDYETPVKPERVDMDLDDGKRAPKRKRVKWDKELLQRFELDETNLDGIRKGAEMARARAVTKGCLATQVLLDPLGNVPQADVPIANLVKEQVVVTKLVYIEDLPPSERPKRVAATKANARIGTA